jgi:phosphoglycolate phosphatase
MLKISKNNGEIVLANPEIILFDKDGTLIDVHHYWSSMLKLRSKMIIQKWFSSHKNKLNIEQNLIEAMGVDLLSGRIKLEGPVGIKSRSFISDIAVYIVRSNGVSVSSNQMEEIFDEVDKITSQDMSLIVKPLPGVLDLIKQLSHKGIALAIVSTDISIRACQAMQSLKIEHFFSEIIGADQVQETKPSPDLAILVSSKTGINTDKMMVIGDNPVDIEMGLRANVKTNVAVLTGLSGKNSFKNLNCLVINDLKSIEVK